MSVSPRPDRSLLSGRPVPQKMFYILVPDADTHRPAAPTHAVGPLGRSQQGEAKP